MAVQAVQHAVPAPILAALVPKHKIQRPDARREQQRQAQHVIRRFVRSVLAVLQYGHAIGLGLVGQVKPLVCGDLEFGLVVVPAPDLAHLPVVGRLGRRDRKRKGGLERNPAFVPVDRVGKLDPFAGWTTSQAHLLLKARSAKGTRDL